MITGIGLQSANIRRTKTILTNAQILALPTTAITVVPAPGASRLIMPLLYIVRSRISAGAYTNLNAGGFAGIQYNGAFTASGFIADSLTTTPVLAYFSDFFGTATDWLLYLQPYFQQVEPSSDEWGVFPVLHATGNIINKALEIFVDNQGSGNFTGGNAANSLEVTTLYTVESTS